MSDKTYSVLVTVGWGLVAIGAVGTVIKRLTKV
jgi:preprotein translocase subunit Sss1